MNARSPKHLACFLFAALACPGPERPALADEGMWTLTDFPREKLQRRYGFTPTEEWLRHVQLSSLRIANGCSASFVSSKGLVMTNHHCVTGCLEELATPQRDPTKDGYYASAQASELKCSNMEINQLLEVHDVTAKMEAATRGLSDAQFGSAMKAEKNKLESECATASNLRCDLVNLYHGGKYHLYKYKRYSDVRLVFAPENQTAQFGGDPDNFMFPRFALDVSFLRIYENNQPVKSPDFFKWQPAGPAEGELVFASGHPGTTQRLMTVAQLEQLRDVELPEGLTYLAELRGQMVMFGRRGPAEKRMLTDPLYGVENFYKVQVGQHQALSDRNFMNAKRAAEQALRAQVAKNPEWQKLYGGAWDALSRAQDSARKLGRLHQYLEGGAGFRSALFQFARTLVRGADERKKPSPARLREYSDPVLPETVAHLMSKEPVHVPLEELTLTYSLTKLREALGPDHPLIKKTFGQYSPEEIARNLVANSRLADPAVRKQLWDGGAAAAPLWGDPMLKFARAIDADARQIRQRYEDEVTAVEAQNTELVAKAIFAVQGTAMYPDATFSLRLTYGTVKGFSESYREIEPITRFKGAFERHTGREPFVLPPSWLAAKSRIKLDTPLNFSSTLDIIGGNSGSPILNKDAQVVGVVFDGNIYSLGNSFQFDENLSRAVTVHSAGLLEALRAIYNAAPLVKELTSK